MIIQNGANTPINQNPGTLPYVGDALQDWFQPMVFTTIVTTIENFQSVEVPTNVNFQGVWQVQSPQDLAIKPEGERNWSWFMLHADPSLALDPDDVVYYLGVQYRVKSKRDYTEYGYIQYELILDYTGSGPNP